MKKGLFLLGVLMISLLTGCGKEAEKTEKLTEVNAVVVGKHDAFNEPAQVYFEVEDTHEKVTIKDEVAYNIFEKGDKTVIFRRERYHEGPNGEKENYSVEYDIDKVKGNEVYT